MWQLRCIATWGRATSSQSLSAFITRPIRCSVRQYLWLITFYTPDTLRYAVTLTFDLLALWYICSVSAVTRKPRSGKKRSAAKLKAFRHMSSCPESGILLTTSARRLDTKLQEINVGQNIYFSCLSKSVHRRRIMGSAVGATACHYVEQPKL